MKPSLLALSLAAGVTLAGPALAQDAPAPPAHAHDMPAMPGMDHDASQGGMAPAGMTHDMAHMESALGSYPLTRDASGTSWQPDASAHEGLHLTSGGWMVMAHGLLNGVYDSQSGPRGGDKAFASGMAMVMAQRPLGDGDTLQLRAMLSPDPAMGPSGYPLLYAAGETADGSSHLVDRQHPHDFVMELSGAVSHAFTVKDSAFLYAGLPGEPAFGPPTFMHRLSSMDSPEAPISHHWLDSTHITFGVITGGFVHDRVKLEASAFRGREPDQHRWDIEGPRLDSWSVRASVNPTANLALQASFARLASPEQLHPDENEDRWSVSALYTVPFGKDGWWSSTLAYGSKRLSDTPRDYGAWLAETALKPNDPWTVFLRAEGVQNPELLGAGRVADAAKLSVGAIHDWRLGPHLKFGVGALHAFDFTPGALRAAYGSSPGGTMGFVRIKLG